jgi:hypothetical protein
MTKGWEQLERPPGWLEGKGREIRQNRTDFLDKDFTFFGDTYVYRLRIGPGNHGHDFNWSRQLKSDYYNTTRNEGTCPNCQSYVRRYSEDRFLTCHRCGWTVGKPVLRWIRYPSWIDYYFS